VITVASKNKTFPLWSWKFWVFFLLGGLVGAGSHSVFSQMLVQPVTQTAPETAGSPNPIAAPAAIGVGEPYRQDTGDSRRNAIVRAAERVGPSVVSISVLQTRVYQRSPFPYPFEDDFFQRFFRPPLVEYKEQVPGLGSGFIIDKRGYVMTNEHVVHDAEEITVTLTDGREFTGELVGSDPTYDLAVIKIAEGEDLPVSPLCDTDDLMVGEWAIAIGNPFGFLLNDTQPSVTAGVVSATRRDVKTDATNLGIYKDMIQTDAAINPGNSGGPLVNADGEVIGINTFIFTQTGGSLGIGFAIPISRAKRVVAEIIKYGRVRSVWIGLVVDEITPYVARYRNVSDPKGLLVSGVDKGSPADKAGIQKGDIIRKINGVPISNAKEARRSLFGSQVGDTVVLTVERNSKIQDMELLLVEARG
jgi:serine protease Do